MIGLTERPKHRFLRVKSPDCIVCLVDENGEWKDHIELQDQPDGRHEFLAFGDLIDN